MRLKALYIMGECLPLYKITHFLIMYQNQRKRKLLRGADTFGGEGVPGCGTHRESCSFLCFSIPIQTSGNFYISGVVFLKFTNEVLEFISPITKYIHSKIKSMGKATLIKNRIDCRRSV